VGDHIDEGAVGQARIGGHEVSQPKVIVLSWSAERIGPVLGTYVLAETMAVMRTRELGIRAALGATSKSLTLLVLRESVVLVGLGLAAGLLLSYLGANVIRAFLFRVQPLDATTLAAAATLILLLAIAVSMRPALRAARVDLAEVLRSE
jgi:putative ABC transport system permease protein